MTRARTQKRAAERTVRKLELGLLEHRKKLCALELAFEQHGGTLRSFIEMAHKAPVESKRRRA